MKKPQLLDSAAPNRVTRLPPVYPGDVPKVCANCEHFDDGLGEAADKPARRPGNCHNGISGRLTTRSIDGCAYGFYPCTKQFPLKAGPGGIR